MDGKKREIIRHKRLSPAIQHVGVEAEAASTAESSADKRAVLERGAPMIYFPCSGSAVHRSPHRSTKHRSTTWLKTISSTFRIGMLAGLDPRAPGLDEISIRVLIRPHDRARPAAILP